MRRLRALIYAFLGGAMCWSTYQQGNAWMTAGVAFFTSCAIVLALAPLGKIRITWDEYGITIKKFPAATVSIPWSELKKMKVDHLGYHVKARNGQFRISLKQMPEALLAQIRTSIRTNQPD
jgi:hypothetical protein